jgi:hypothetical protein
VQIVLKCGSLNLPESAGTALPLPIQEEQVKVEVPTCYTSLTELL